MLGGLIAIVAALSFSLSDVSIRRGVARLPVTYGAIVTVLLGVPLFLIATAVTGQLFSIDDLPLKSYFFLGAAGVIHYVVGRYFNYAAIEAIGAARTQPIHALGLPYSVIIAYLFLDEGITAGMVGGIALIMIAPAIMVERRKRAPVPATNPAPAAATSVPASATAPAATNTPSQPGAIPLRQAEGYIYAVIAAACYGSSPVFIRSALEGESGLSLLGGFISYIAAGSILLLSLALPSRRHLVHALEPRNVRVFFPAGFFVFMAQMFRFIALSLASVAVVTTLLRFSTIFTLALTYVMNRDLERITWRVVAGVVLSLAGAVLLVLSST